MVEGNTVLLSFFIGGITQRMGDRGTSFSIGGLFRTKEGWREAGRRETTQPFAKSHVGPRGAGNKNIGRKSSYYPFSWEVWKEKIRVLGGRLKRKGEPKVLAAPGKKSEGRGCWLHPTNPIRRRLAGDQKRRS